MKTLSRRVTPLRRVPAKRIPKGSPAHVYLENDRVGVRLPLQDKRGLLNGVFETPTHEIIEVRFSGGTFKLYSGAKPIGEVTSSLDHRILNETYRGMGLASEVFDRAEENKAAKHGKKGKAHTIYLYPFHADTAAFLAKRGYVGTTSADEKERKKMLKTKKRLPANQHLSRTLLFEKKTPYNRFARVSKWHRIRVLGQDGKPKWLTLAVVQPEN